MRRPDHILFWGELPPYTLSGISLSNQQILNILTEEGFEVCILEEKSWKKSSFGKILYYLFLYLKLLLKLLFKPFDVFYYTIPVSLSGLRKFQPVILIARLFRSNMRIIGHIHRGDAGMFIKQGKKNQNLLAATLRRTHDVILLSDTYASEISDLLAGKRKWILSNTSAIERSGYTPLKPYSRRFVCLSNYIPTKGLLELVACFAREAMKEFVLTIYGQQNDPDFYEELRRMSTSNVLLEGKLKRGDLARSLDAFDCLILPSPNEGMPLVILEAMSLGLPVVSTRVGVVEEMLGADYPFLTEPGSTSSLERAILSFDACREKDIIGKQLYDRYQRYYSNDLHSKRVRKIFTSQQHTSL